MKPIVVGVDGSKASEAALWWAHSTAEALGRAVRAVTVVPATGWALTPDCGCWLPGEPATVEHEARAALDRAIANAIPLERRSTIERKVVLGTPWRYLVEQSAQASLIVVGANRRRALSRLLDGAIQPALLRKAACPVVVVPEHHAAVAAAFELLDRELALVG